MLLSWCDRLKIVLTPEYIKIVRLSAGLKPREVYNKTVPCDSPEKGESLWQPALRLLQQLLPQASTGKAQAEILLSNHFMRYQLVKAQQDLSSHEEEEGFVRFSFTEIYGEEANQWALKWASGLGQHSQLASALDEKLLYQLDQLFNENKIKCISMQPYLMAAFNYVRNSIDMRPLWFILVESGRVCISLFREGEWTTFHSSKLGRDWAADLPKVIEREFQKVNPEAATENMLLCLPDYFDHKRLSLNQQAIRILTMTPATLLQGNVMPVANVEVKQ